VGRVARRRCKAKRAVTLAVECTGGVPLDPEPGRVWSDAARRDGSTGDARRRQLQPTSDEQQKGAKFTRSFVTWSSCSSAPRFSSLTGPSSFAGRKATQSPASPQNGRACSPPAMENQNCADTRAVECRGLFHWTPNAGGSGAMPQGAMEGRAPLG
jgi:hypothetical protein